MENNRFFYNLKAIIRFTCDKNNNDKIRTKIYARKCDFLKNICHTK